MPANEIILAKYGEIALKGLNKKTFEDILMKNIRRRLRMKGSYTVSRAQSTIYIEPNNESSDIDEAMDVMKKVFGIAALCRAKACDKTFEAIAELAPEYLEAELMGARTFKVTAKRADKSFPMKSPEICMELGAVLLEKFPHLEVDVHNPEVTVTVEIRDTNAYTAKASRVQEDCL